MPSDRRSKPGWTFRVRGVPLGWTKERLRSVFDDMDPPPDPHVRSLACEFDGLSQTGTITFENLPIQLQDGGNDRIPLSKCGQRRSAQKLVFDDHFEGITTLHMPEPMNHKLDIIAIAGLNGHAFGSFKEIGEDYVWLLDSVPARLPEARIMIYGYESDIVNGTEIATIANIATFFREALYFLGKATSVKPILIVAHSLGGLIVKKAIIQLAKSKIEDEKRLLRAIYGINFFGVPHLGMDINSLIAMAGNGPSAFIVRSLDNTGSDILHEMNVDFHLALGEEGQAEVFSFFETKPSPTAQKNEKGEWKLTGPEVLLVPKASAIHSRPWESNDTYYCGVPRTHSNLVKFDEWLFARVWPRMESLAERAMATQGRLKFSTKFLVPFSPNDGYVQRAAILETLKAQLGYCQPKCHTKSQLRAALYGLGGVGKTQIALAFVYWLQDAHPDVPVFWVHASSAERFRQSYAYIAEKLEIPGRDDHELDVKLLVKSWLETRLESRWVMVIDNADDAELFIWQEAELDAPDGASEVEQTLGRFVPDCRHGSILITSRNKQAVVALAQGKPIIEVKKMTASESNQLIRRILDDENISLEESSQLSSRLEHLPLALAQAASFIKGNSVSISYYVELLDGSDSGLVDLLSKPFETVGRDSETPRAVTATWIISFELVKRRNSLAAQCLSFLSYFDHQAIPRDFIHYYYNAEARSKDAQGSPAVALTEALGKLFAFSFISAQKSNSLDIHRLVRLVTQKWLATQGEATKFCKHALNTIDHFFPHGTVETRHVCLEYLPHARAVLDNEWVKSGDALYSRSTILHRMAGYFNCQGQWREAEQHELEAVRIQKNLLGDEHPDTLISKSNLATIYIHLDRLTEAEEIIVPVLEMQKKKVGEADPDTLLMMSDLAVILWKQGRFPEAEEQETRAIDIATKALPETESQLLTLKSHLASTHLSQGRLESARDLFTEVLGKTKLIEDHPEVLADKANLASVLRELGELQEAEKLDTRVLETSSRVLGDNHADTLSAKAGLAATFSEQGRYQEAHDLQQSVLSARKLHLGEEHSDTLSIMADLAATFSELDRWEDAEALEVEVVRIGSRVLPEDHPELLVYKGNLAMTYHHQGRLEDAIQLWTQVQQAQIDKLGEKHFDVLTTPGNVAALLLDAGDVTGALKLYSRVAELSTESLGDAHPGALRQRFNLSMVLKKCKALRRDTEAKEVRARIEELQLDVVEKSKAKLGPDHPDTLFRMAEYAATLEDGGRFVNALAVWGQLLETYWGKFGLLYPPTMIGMGKIAVNLGLQGQREKAVNSLQDLIIRSEGNHSPDALVTRSLKSYLADVQKLEQSTTGECTTQGAASASDAEKEEAKPATGFMPESAKVKSTRKSTRRQASLDMTKEEPPRKISKQMVRR